MYEGEDVSVCLKSDEPILPPLKGYQSECVCVQFAVHGCDEHRQTSLDLGLFTRGETPSLPLAPLSQLPEDRLHRL